MKITSPTRIDFVGSTLDLEPLYLFHNGCTVINAAIDIKTEVEIQPSDTNYFVIKSEDQNCVETFDLSNIPSNSQIKLLTKTIDVFSRYVPDDTTPIRITTNSQAPIGSGLGASSSLLIALLGGLNKYYETGLSEYELITLANKIETSILEVPTGRQDYYPALFGGLIRLSFGFSGDRFEKLDQDQHLLKEIEKRLILIFTGKNHFSAKDNWEIYKNRIEGNPKYIDLFNGLKENAEQSKDNLSRKDLQSFFATISQDWKLRKQLHEKIASEAMNVVISSIQNNFNNRIVYNVCGAGAGGSFYIICDPDIILELIKFINKFDYPGIEVLDYSFTTQGLMLKS